MNMTFLKFLLPAIFGLAMAGSAAAQTKPLEMEVFSAEENGFYVSSVLVTGKTDAVLFDTQFSRANALRVAALALDSGKKLTNTSALTHTRDYLLQFEQALDKSSNSAELIAAMKKAYPDAGLGIALDIGAKVNMGEMKW